MHMGSAASRKHLQTSIQSTTMPALEHRSGSNTCMPGWPTAAERATTGQMPINVPGHAIMVHHAFNSAQVTHLHTQDTAYARYVHQGALPCPASLHDCWTVPINTFFVHSMQFVHKMHQHTLAPDSHPLMGLPHCTVSHQHHPLLQVAASDAAPAAPSAPLAAADPSNSAPAPAAPLLLAAGPHQDPPCPVALPARCRHCCQPELLHTAGLGA